jgi:glycosyltransferase involved in cell wall biosynthesis
MDIDPVATPPAGAVPRVSVILVTYNHEAYIEQALESVLSQKTDFPVEIIITEDCSTDRTGELVEAAAAREPHRIRLVRSAVNTNTNLVTIRALEMAKGEFVAFLDGDDYWTSPDKLSKQVRFLDEHSDCAMCFHDVVMVDSAGRDIAPSYRVKMPTPHAGEYDDIVRSNFIAGPSPMIRRNAISPPPTWLEDAEFGDWPLYILAAEQGSIGFLDESLAAHRVHAGGYWNAMGEEQQFEQCVRFLQRVWREAPPSRRPVVNRSLTTMTCGLLYWRLRTRGPASAAKGLGDVFIQGCRQGNPQWVLTTIGRVLTAIPRRVIRNREV